MDANAKPVMENSRAAAANVLQHRPVTGQPVTLSIHVAADMVAWMEHANHAMIFQELTVQLVQ